MDVISENSEPYSSSPSDLIPVFLQDTSPQIRSGCVGGCFTSTPKMNMHRLALSSGLTQAEVQALHDRFKKISGPKGYMTKTEFKSTLGLIGMTPNEYIPNRMFSIFDTNGDGVLTFEEYLHSFAILLRGTEESRLELSFHLADSSGTGRLTFPDFSSLVDACQATTGALLDKPRTITRREMEDLFNQISNKNSFISLEQYVNGSRTNSKFLELIGILPKSVSQFKSRVDHLRADLPRGLPEEFLTELDAILTLAENNVEDIPDLPRTSTPPLVRLAGKTPKSAYLGPKKGLAVHFGHENWNMVLSMMIGIRIAAGRFEINRPLQGIDFNVKEKFSIVPQLSNFLDSRISEKIKLNRFIDYCPLVFRKLRAANFSEEEYLRSVGPEQLLGNMVLGNLSSLAEQTSEGKGGSFFYYTADQKFVIKTVSPEEKHLIKRILKSYYEHLLAYPDSLIVRFYGLHGLRVKRDSKFSHHEEEVYFVVMGNLFNTPLKVDRRYDLKGSWIGRTAKNKDETGKDNDFIERGEKINLDIYEKKRFLDRISADCDFFKIHNIIDYSLLVGIHDTDVSDPIHAGGIMSSDMKQVYYFGIIDILCVWGTRKKFEHFFKAIRYVGGDGISAMETNSYAKRFFKFIEKIT